MTKVEASQLDKKRRSALNWGDVSFTTFMVVSVLRDVFMDTFDLLNIHYAGWATFIVLMVAGRWREGEDYFRGDHNVRALLGIAVIVGAGYLFALGFFSEFCFLLVGGVSYLEYSRHAWLEEQVAA